VTNDTEQMQPLSQQVTYSSQAHTYVTYGLFHLCAAWHPPYPSLSQFTRADVSAIRNHSTGGGLSDRQHMLLINIQISN